MKLEHILEKVNSFEKNDLLKVISGIVNDEPKNLPEINKILSDPGQPLKNVDSINVVNVFNLIEDEFAEYLGGKFLDTTSQLDILIDIVIRDGNCIMQQDWFSRLYEVELKSIRKKVKFLDKSFVSEKSEISEKRKRDYKIYRSCMHTAYKNDELRNADPQITADEQSILQTLASQLELSQEEIKLVKYLVIPAASLSVDAVINDLKSVGAILYSKKNNTVYVPDEVVRVLRKVREKEVADKFFRRVLRLLREPQLNLICKKHNIDWRCSPDEKIREMIKEGISFSGVLAKDIYKDDANVTEKKKFLNDLCNNKLNISPPLKGITLEDKITNLIAYFETVERDSKVGISIDGYEKLLLDMGKAFPHLNEIVKMEFELQDENVLKSGLLLDYNIKPRDVLETVPEKDLKVYCECSEIKMRGDIIRNILDSYKDSENIYLENFENVGFRDLAALKENGIKIKESDLGIRFEELTKAIFTKLGFNVDEELRKQLNTKKDKMDIVLNLGNNELIIVECKSVKESGYNKFSSVSRQLKAYTNVAQSSGFKVVKTLLVAPDFSDEFINDCNDDYELNLSLIGAATFTRILNAFKDTKHTVFPYQLFMRDVLIQEGRVLKALRN